MVLYQKDKAFAKCLLCITPYGCIYQSRKLWAQFSYCLEKSLGGTTSKNSKKKYKINDISTASAPLRNSTWISELASNCPTIQPKMNYCQNTFKFCYEIAKKGEKWPVFQILLIIGWMVGQLETSIVIFKEFLVF